MKILNADIETIKETTRIKITEDLEWEFHSLPLSFDIEAEAQLPSPDPEARTPAMERACNRIQAVKMIVDSLEPGQVEFDAVLTDPPDYPAYYKAITQELAAIGFSLKHLKNVSDGLAALNSVSEADLGDAEEDFSGVAS